MKKKVRVLAIALVMAVALVGAGYAAWNSTITDNTVLQTGKWNVVLEADSDYSYYGADAVYNFHEEDGGYEEEDLVDYDWKLYDTIENDTIVGKNGSNYVYTLEPEPSEDEVTDDNGRNTGATSCTFRFYNLHPGTRAMTRFEIRNDGTIPAKIKAVNVDIKYWKDGDWVGALDNGVVADGVPENVKDAIEAMKVLPYFSIHHGTGNDSTDLIKDVEVDLLGLDAKLDDLVGEELLPGDKIWTADHESDELETGADSDEPVFTFKLPANALTGDEPNENLGMNAAFKVVVDFDFVQYNEVAAE